MRVHCVVHVIRDTICFYVARAHAPALIDRARSGGSGDEGGGEDHAL